jgi:hypothetical protein
MILRTQPACQPFTKQCRHKSEQGFKVEQQEGAAAAKRAQCAIRAPAAASQPAFGCRCSTVSLSLANIAKLFSIFRSCAPSEVVTTDQLLVKNI